MMLTPMPIQTAREGLAPVKRAMSADQIGCVEIMAVLSATVVSRSEGIHVAK